MKLLRNECVCREGEDGNAFFILASGKVSLSRQLQDSANLYYQKYVEIGISTIDQPTFFGEEVLFKDTAAR